MILQKLYESVTLAQTVYLMLVVKFVTERDSGSVFEPLLVLCYLLHSQCNVICLFLLLCLLHLLQQQQWSDKAQGGMISLVARASFFYLGNSNSLSTIDVTAGYTGLTVYNSLAVVVLLAVHTFAGPLLTYAFFMERRGNAAWAETAFFASCWLDLVVFSALCILMRYHLFVWTVFSPKLLYFGMELVVFNCFFLVIKLCNGRKLLFSS